MDIPHIPDEVEDKIEEEEDKTTKRRSTISPVKEDLNVGKDKTSQVSDCRHDQLAAAMAQWVRAFALQQKVGCSNPSRDRSKLLKQVVTAPLPNAWH